MTKCVLGDLMEVTRGASLAGKYYATAGDKIRLTLANFDYANNCFKPDTSKDNVFYTQAVDDRFVLKEGDIITPLTEQTPGLLGTTARIPESGKYIQSQDVALLKPFTEKLDPDYCFYLVSSKAVRNQLGAMSQQTKIRHSSPDKIKSCTVFLPELEKQRRIGAFLSAIDRKIALNRKRIATLEAMAKEIYDYWFVQFDFPDAHGRPYKSSGGEMVYNPDLKREIPKGWAVRPLGEVAEVVNGATPSTTNPKNYDGDIVWITPKDLSDQRSKFTYGGCRTISREGYDSCSTHMLPRGSILMSSRAPIGLLSIAAVDLCTNQGFKSFVPKEIDDNLYLYYYLKEHMAQIEAMGSGTTFKEVSRESMISFPIPYESDRRAYASFVVIVKPIFNQQELLVKELARLSALRDFLLPVLMNGQVKVR